MKYVETLEGLKTVPEIMEANKPKNGMFFYLELEESKAVAMCGGVFNLAIPEMITAIQCQIADLDLQVQIGILTTLLKIAIDKKNLSEPADIMESNGEPRTANQTRQSMQEFIQ